MKFSDGDLTHIEVAKRLGVDYRTVSRWVEQKKIKSKKRFKERLFPLSEVARISGGK